MTPHGAAWPAAAETRFVRRSKNGYTSEVKQASIDDLASGGDFRRLYEGTSSNRDDARMGANNLLNWTANHFAIEQGLRQLHLGGGLRARDGLFKFKQTFGGRELAYGVSGLIIDHEAHQAHLESRATECDTTSDELLASRHFPAYRGATVTNITGAQPCP